MQKYALGDVVESLEPWPFDNAASNYRILRGEPRASGRIDHGDNNGPYRLGIWSCTEGAFECTELGDELQTVISGRLLLTRVGGESIECGPGDSIYTRKGERVVWDIREEVTKVFFTVL
jgi:uncharacterized cupin superfamily protein